MSRHHPTRFPSLDRILGGGLPRGALTVLGGDAGIGASAMAMNLALGAAQGGARTVLLSSESREDGLRMQAVSQLSGVPHRLLESPQSSESRRASIETAWQTLEALPLRLANAPVDFVEELPQMVGVDWELLVVDGLEAMAMEGAGRDEILAGWVARLKRMAVAHDGAVVITAHTTAPLSERQDPRPRLDDFGAAGAIRGMADLVLGLFREEHYRPDRGVIGSAELLVLKNRNGPRAAIDLWFEADCRRFEDLA